MMIYLQNRTVRIDLKIIWPTELKESEKRTKLIHGNGGNQLIKSVLLFPHHGRKIWLFF